MRTFSGNEQFDTLKKTILDSYTKVFPVEKNGHKIELKKIWVDDQDLDINDFTAQKKVRLAGNTWGAPIYASIVLKDATGKVVDTMDKLRMATVPKLTPRGSYIVSGNEYQVNNQLRRKAGVYVVKRATGDEYKAMFNTKGENSRNFELHFDPVSNKYAIKKLAGSDASLPLYPLLHSLGITDEHLKKTWGDKIFEANRATSKSGDIIKIAQRFTGTKIDTAEEASKAMNSYVKGIQIDPKMSEITLGKKFDTLHPELILASSQKLLNVYQGKKPPDDPESLLFKEVLSVEDMFQDKFNRHHIPAIKFSLSKHLGKKTNLKEMIDQKRLTHPVEKFFITDDRSSTPEQYNPVQMLSNLYKLTMTGTGGIKDPHTIVPEVREVHPSHVGFIDPTHTPESQKIGTMLHLTFGSIKDGKDVRTRVYNTRTGKMEELTPIELYSKTVAFPDDVKFDKDGKPQITKATTRVQRNGKVETAAAKDVEYVIPSHTLLFSPSTNLIPFLHNDQGTRVMMGSKMIEQAIPLLHREAPLVQTATGVGKTFHEYIGEKQSVYAPTEGTITKVTSDHIEVDGKKIPIYNNFPLNQKTFITHEPLVKQGDKVKKGQIIADSNFSKNGVLALGKNLKVAYLPYPGLTFEDGIVITESASKKLTTQQIHRSTYEIQKGKRKTSLKQFNALQPNLIGSRHLANFDDEGVIKKGSVVQPGQVVIAGLKYELDSLENASFKKINKALQMPWTASPVRYTGEFPGVVTDIVKRGDRVEVLVKSEDPARESDKLSGLHGNKGVITRVIPDSQAPHLKDGTVPDVFLNPHGIIGRINLGQLYESAASKIALKTGKPYIVTNFDSAATDQKLTKELAAHGLSDMEEMFLPNGKSLGKINVGNPYILRLAKTGKTGFSARMPGTGYDMNRQPMKGGEEGTKSLDLMTFYSMLSHGSKKNLMDAHQKAEMNDEYWRAIETGNVLPSPKPSFVFDKFQNLLRGAGINTHKNGTDIVLAPMTDKEVQKRSNGKISEFNFLIGKDLKEKKGGFFDPGITGGIFGERFSHIELHDMLPNPVFEKAIRSLTNLKGNDYEGIVSGVKHVTPDGKISDKAATGSFTGGAGISHLLKRINMDDRYDELGKSLKTAKAKDLDSINRQMRYIKALKELNLKPEEAYIRKLIPVIPPVHRPVYDMPGQGLKVAPVNHLYQNVGILSEAHKYDVMKFLPDEEKKDLKLDTYKATRALAGLEPVFTRGKEIPIEGFMSQITGDNPKSGFYLNKVITKRQDLVGRGVITSGPDLGVDQLGIPEKMAWKIFHPFIMREYSLAGIKPMDAREEIEKQTSRAKDMLQAAMNKRTVLANRAPSLHKFSIMAFKPVLTDGLAVKIPPLVLKGFGGDFDGDAMTIHVPTSEEAVRESHSMFPSRNLFKPGTGELMMMPSQESAIGIYFLSKTPEGRKQINSVLPQKLHIAGELGSKAAKTLYNNLSKEDPQSYSRLVMKLKDMGDKKAYESGFSVGLKDVLIDRTARDVTFKQADVKVEALKKSHKPGAELDKKVADIYQGAAEDSYQKIKSGLGAKQNNFYHMVNSGARGNNSQLMQMISAPGVMKDAKDRSIPTPIKRSYAEGLSTSDYFIAAYGVRKGMMDRALQTSKPGELNKDIMASTIDNIVTHPDCGTRKGLELPIHNPDAQERYLAKDQAGFHRNELVTPQLISQMGKKGIKTVTVRTPLECIAPKGTCAHCYGLNEHNALPQVGDNLGAVSGQALSEPMTQLVMRTFHTGGVAGGTPVTGGFSRLQQLLRMPEYLAGEASLAQTAGKVTKITPSAAGGHEIHIGDQIHSVRPGLPLKIKVGETVKAGDMLSEGVLHPQELLKYKGMKAAQQYVVDEIKKVYDATLKDTPMKRRTVETVVRSIGNLTKVVHAPKQAEFAPGDVIPFTTADHYNETRKEHMNATDTVGYHLAHPVGSLPLHHEIKEKDVAYLRGQGYNKLDVLKDPLIHAPILKSIERLPMEKKNWMGQLGYRYIKEALTEGAAQAWKSSVEGTHPIPAFAYGSTFGKKKEHY